MNIFNNFQKQKFQLSQFNLRIHNIIVKILELLKFILEKDKKSKNKI